MGPDIQSVERTSQATPFANDFLRELLGTLNQSQGAQTVGPMQTGKIGSGGQQTLASRVGGVNTTGALTDNSSQLIKALQNTSNIRTNRDAAQIQEGFGAQGGRLSTGLAREEGLFRNEAGANLDQLIGSVMMEQAAREQAARQFDVSANQQVLQLFANMAALGIIPSEVIASPGVGSQLLTGGLGAAGAALGAPGGLNAIAGLFGRGGSSPNPVTSVQNVAPPTFPMFGGF